MNDEFAQLVKMPRLCRGCGKVCNGLRCRKCYSIEGRIMKQLEGRGPVSEEEIRGVYMLEKVLRHGERSGKFHEKSGMWTTGLHPYQLALMKAWEKRLRKPIEVTA